MNVVHGEKSELHLAMTQQHAAEKQGTLDNCFVNSNEDRVVCAESLFTRS